MIASPGGIVSLIPVTSEIADRIFSFSNSTSCFSLMKDVAPADCFTKKNSYLDLHVFISFISLSTWCLVSFGTYTALVMTDGHNKAIHRTPVRN